MYLKELLETYILYIFSIGCVDTWRDNHFYNLCIDVYFRCAEYTDEPRFEGW
jgi:hypothetical protein